jgi:hypothetical protein
LERISVRKMVDMQLKSLKSSFKKSDVMNKKQVLRMTLKVVCHQQFCIQVMVCRSVVSKRRVEAPRVSARIEVVRMPL